tara:strand:+ start:5855 stop:7708 length:1854 start_codon:yes stop_codon:yes gene_type:complete
VSGDGIPTGETAKLVNAVIKQESAGNPIAVSSAGAVGLMQLMKPAAEEMGLTVNDEIDERTDPKKSIIAGTKYLTKQINKYEGNLTLALMAYNWGGGNVDAWLKTGKGTKGQVVPQETHDYLKKVMGNYNGVKPPATEQTKVKAEPTPPTKVNVTPEVVVPIENEPVIKATPLEIDTPSKVDSSEVVDTAAGSNPAFKEIKPIVNKETSIEKTPLDIIQEATEYAENAHKNIKPITIGDKVIDKDTPIADVSPEELITPNGNVEEGIFSELLTEFKEAKNVTTESYNEIKKEAENWIKKSDIGQTVTESKSVEEFTTIAFNGLLRKGKMILGLGEDVELSIPSKKETHEGILPNSNFWDNTVGQTKATATAEAKRVAALPAPDKVLYKSPTKGRTFRVAESKSLNTVKFNAHNRGDRAKVSETSGMPITTHRPFTEAKPKSDTTVLAIDVDGTLHAGKAGDFQNTEGWKFSTVAMHKVTGFKNKDGAQSFTQAIGNSRYVVPLLTGIHENGGSQNTFLNFLVSKESKNTAKFGDVQGGRVIFKNPKTKEIRLVSGSVDYIKQELEIIKKDSEYVEMYRLDNGTYAGGLQTTDGVITSEDWKNHDNQNTKGGHGLYLK